LNGLDHFRTKNGSRQGQNLALTVFFVPNSLDSGTLEQFSGARLCKNKKLSSDYGHLR
jgi:hypothetical protein